MLLCCYELQKAPDLGDATKEDYINNMKANLCSYHDHPEAQASDQ